MDDYFSLVKMSRYISSDENSEIENFATESFVFLLNYLKYTNKKTLHKIINLFGFNNINVNDLIFKTQLHNITKKSKQKVIPDIIIEYKNKLTVIEVKIDSPLGEDQLKKYKNIENVKEVYLLSKNVIQIGKFKRILWTTIYDILAGSNNYFIKTFLYFMEENGMAAYKLRNGIYSALEQIENLCQLFKISFGDIKDYELFHSPNISKKGYIDFIVKYKGKKIFAISQITKHKRYFVISVTDEKFWKKIDDSGYEWKFEDWVFDEIEIEKILSKKNASEQAGLLNDWFIDVIKKIEKFQKL